MKNLILSIFFLLSTIISFGSIDVAQAGYINGVYNSSYIVPVSKKQANWYSWNKHKQCYQKRNNYIICR